MAIVNDSSKVNLREKLTVSSGFPGGGRIGTGDRGVLVLQPRLDEWILLVEREYSHFDSQGCAAMEEIPNRILCRSPATPP